MRVLSSLCAAPRWALQAGDVFGDGYVEWLCTSLQTALPDVAFTTMFTVNGTENPLQQPVVLARDLFMTPDRRSTILLFPDIDVVAEAVLAAVTSIHNRTRAYQVWPCMCVEQA